MSRSTTSSAYQLQYMHKPSALLQPPPPRALAIGVAKEYTEPTSFSINNFHVRSCVASCTGTKVLDAAMEFRFKWLATITIELSSQRRSNLLPANGIAVLRMFLLHIIQLAINASIMTINAINSLFWSILLGCQLTYFGKWWWCEENFS